MLTLVGVVMTNRHIAEDLQALPNNTATAIVFSQVEIGDGERGQPVLFRPVTSYNILESFWAEGQFYGEEVPDIALLAIDLQGVRALEFLSDPNTIEIGKQLGTAGFAMGETTLVRETKVVQLTPFLRRGIVSSVYPFPGPNPHGFTMDIVTQGGESGSPVFLPNSEKVIGMVHAGYEDTNITIAIPAHILEGAMAAALDGEDLRLDQVPTLQQMIEEQPRSETMVWEDLPDNR